MRTVNVQCPECDEIVWARGTGAADNGYAEFTCPECGEVIWERVS